MKPLNQEPDTLEAVPQDEVTPAAWSLYRLPQLSEPLGKLNVGATSMDIDYFFFGGGGRIVFCLK